MKKVSYIGNDETMIFYFSFPYYEKSNIVVTVNGAAASGVEVVGNPGGINADFPFIGGHIAFDNAPGDTDVITISRVLPLSRVVDYQQMVQIDPKTLNMDMNYIKQVLDDLNEELDEIQETTDTDKLNEVKQKIDAINERLDGLNNATASIGGINGIAPQINTIDTRTSGMIDFVVDSQTPTAENNYTWFRKYKSGWVEQGGYAANTTNGTTINLPIEMANKYYDIHIQSRFTNFGGQCNTGAVNCTTTSFIHYHYGDTNQSWSWCVKGFMA
ncbi:MAG: hypothetical protein IJU89_02630 [Alphaproteobacteria bacterium]|nr:hypothetical protein [Alphaproteobacteria bacterium]